MLNEVQKSMRVGRFVNYAMLLTVLTGLVFLIYGLRLITKDIPMPEEEFAPRITAPKQYSVVRDDRRAAPKEPEIVHFEVGGREVVAMASDVQESASPATAKSGSRSGSITIQ